MSVFEKITSDELTLTVELRPPRMGQSQSASMDAWFTMHAAVQGIVGDGTVLFLTDGAVGAREEENLHHLVTNLEEDISRDLICPFLTTKHTLEYCMWYAARAVESGCGALTVLGGDKHVGPPRCVPHGYVLRQRIRERYPDLRLGGWANPHKDPERQVGFLSAPNYCADFYLTQLVSHHDLDPVDRFLDAAAQADVAMPGVFGVFYYRSGRVKTLERLAKFFPVPIEGIVREFEAGASPAEVCARTIRALAERGVRRVYVSNLSAEHAQTQLDAIRALL